MKKSLGYILVIVSIVSGLLFAGYHVTEIAHAQTPPASVGTNVNTNPEVKAVGLMDALNPLNAVNNVILGLLVLTSNVLGWCILATGFLLDASINFSLEISTMLKEGSNGANAINYGWSIVRDFGNMFFIFILLYEGINAIVHRSSAEAKKKVVFVLIAAVLVNFSMLFAKLIIDAGNIFALWFKSGISNIVMQSGATSMGEAINKAFLVQKFYAITDFTSFEAINAITALSMRVALQCVIVYVFLRVSFLFIARTVAFFFLLIFAPIGFLGNVIPHIKDHAGDWWKTLINQTMVAPVFLLLMYIVMSLITSDFLNTEGVLGAERKIAGSEFAVGDFFSVIILMFLFQTIYSVTKKFSGSIGEKVTDIGMKVTGLAVAAATGGASMAGRATVGRYAAGVAESQTLKDAASKGGVGGFAARLKLSTAKTVSNASFDARATDLYKSSTGALGLKAKIPGMDLSKPTKGGFTDMVENKAKEQKKIAETLIIANDKDRKTVDEKEKEIKESAKKEAKKYKDEVVPKAEKGVGEQQEALKNLTEKLSKLQEQRSNPANAEWANKEFDQQIKATQDDMSQAERNISEFQKQIEKATKLESDLIKEKIEAEKNANEKYREAKQKTDRDKANVENYANYVGRESADYGNVGRAAGVYIGGALGGPKGMLMGAALGGEVGKYAGKIGTFLASGNMTHKDRTEIAEKVREGKYGKKKSKAEELVEEIEKKVKDEKKEGGEDEGDSKKETKETPKPKKEEGGGAEGGGGEKK